MSVNYNNNVSTSPRTEVEMNMNPSNIFRHMGVDDDDDALVTAHWVQTPPQHLLGGGVDVPYTISQTISPPAGIVQRPYVTDMFALNNSTRSNQIPNQDPTSMYRNTGEVLGHSTNPFNIPIAPPAIHTIPPADEDTPNLFIANLSNDVDDDALSAAFSPFGIILSAKVMLDIHTGRSRGFGFVMFDSGASGAMAMRTLHNTPIGEKGQRMSVTKAQTSGQSAITETTKLYVRNVPLTVTEQALKDHFAQFGSVKRFARKEDTAAKNDVTRQSMVRQQAVPATMVIFLEYNTVQEAQQAVRGIHGKKPWPGMGIPLLAKTAETTENRNVRRERQRQKVDEKRVAVAVGSPIPPAIPPTTPSASLHVHATYSPSASLMMSASNEFMNANTYPYMDTIYNNSVMSVGANAGSSSFAPASLTHSPQNGSAPIPLGATMSKQSQMAVPGYPPQHQQPPPPMYPSHLAAAVPMRGSSLPMPSNVMDGSHPYAHLQPAPPYAQHAYGGQPYPNQFRNSPNNNGGVMFMIGSDGLARPMVSGSSNQGKHNASASMSQSQDNMQSLAPHHLQHPNPSSPLMPSHYHLAAGIPQHQQLSMPAPPYGHHPATMGMAPTNVQSYTSMSNVSLDPQLMIPMGAVPPGMR